jgi:hypothetical protein
MKFRLLILALISAGSLGLAAERISANCRSGAYAASCAGPNGAAVVRKPTAPTYRTGGAAAGAVHCANGLYRAGCVGPNGAAAVRKPPPY